MRILPIASGFPFEISLFFFDLPGIPGRLRFFFVFAAAAAAAAGTEEETLASPETEFSNSTDI